MFGISPVALQSRLEPFLAQLEIKTSDITIDQSSDFGELKLIIKYHLNQNQPFLKLLKFINDSFRSYIYSETFYLSECLIDCLKNHHQTVSVAESCTGGLISSQITKISGASSVFDTGFVTYSNRSKMKFLGVDESIILKNGAVSKQTAEAMVSGLLHATQSDFGMAVTGIAGPTGGTTEKPNGTVYIGWGSQNNIQTQHFLIPLPRLEFQNKVTSIAIHQLIRFILKEDAAVNYYFDNRSNNFSL